MSADNAQRRRGEGMTNLNLHLLDDGTLDTVIGCPACGWEGRYNPECPYDDDDDCQVRGDDWRIDQALEMAEEDHPDCEQQS